MKNEDQKPTIITLTICLIMSMCANFYAYCILPEKQWEEAEANTWIEIDPSYFTTGQLTAVVPREEIPVEDSLSDEELTATPTPTKKPAQPSIQYEGATVYVTKSGTKFHRGTCSSLSKSKIPMLFEEAIGEGYGPCGKCKP